ncbi:MAG TPA: polyvinylalcohol dehydrogenase, partial [Planctomycetaceae bacterium]|nr:polyvinylalcohol dehydrogenase [Planctomycetaceae bacterium]
DAVVALVVADSEKFQLASSFKIPEQTAHRAPSGRNWTPPVIANGHLYIRDQELLFCYKIKR